VTGSLHAPGKRGVGVTVSLVESNQILSAYTFWQQAFDAPSEPNKQDDDENLYRIAEYVAVWLLFETRARFGDRELELLGAHDWYSYALFKAGLFAENDERQLAARNLYVMALRRSPSFRGARTNLGLWYIRHKEPQRAIRHLQQAIDEANDELNSDRDASLYVAKYNLAAIEDEAGLTDKAIADTQDLSAMIDAALRKIEAGEEGYTDPALKQNLQDIKPAAKAMLAGIRVREGDDSALKILDTLSSTARLGVKEQYNLACSFSLAAAYVRNNPSPEHPKSAATYLDQSLEHLKRAFQLFPRATAQAQTDPTLEEVQQQRAHELSALIARFDSSGNVDDIEIVEERKLPLAELAIVGDEHARLLAEQGIESPEQLLAKTVSRSGRKSLAKELGLSYRIVTLWAQAADLTRIVGLRIPQVNLLASYRINTIAELASCSARQLAEDLAIMSISMSTGDSPDEIELTRWIEEAQTTTRPTVIE
jgi:tetratricopeptide (TPR) repeat protein